MLLWFRRVLAGTLAKILLVLMIISFAFFGYESAFTGNPKTDVVATVADIDIPAARLLRARDQLMDNYARALGGQQLPDFFKNRLLDDALKLLINDALITAAAHKWDMPIAEERLATVLGTFPAFQNDKKQFDPELFKAVIAKAGLSTEDVLDDVRISEWQRYFRDGFLSTAVVPESLVIATLQQESETRSAKIITLPLVAVTEPVADETLKPWFETKRDRYKTPEKRVFGYVTLGLTFTDAAIQAYYNTHAASFVPPEKRRVTQLFCATQDCVTQHQGLTTLDPKGQGVTDLGVVEKKDLIAPLRDAAFGLALNVVSAPIKTDFGWTFLQVTQILAPTTPPLSAIRQQVMDAMKTPEALEALYKQTTDLETALAETGSLEKAAQSLNLPYNKTGAVDQDNVPEALKNLGGQIWGLPARGTTALQEVSPDNYVMAAVEKIDAATPQDFAAARATVLRDYQAEQAKTLLQQKRDALHKKLQAMKPEERVAFRGDEDLDVTESVAITRARAAEAFQADVADVLFDGKIGEVKTVDEEKAAKLIIVIAIQRPDPQTFMKAEKEVVRDRLRNAMAQDFYDAFLKDLKTLFPVKINQDVMERLRKNG